MYRLSNQWQPRFDNPHRLDQSRLPKDVQKWSGDSHWAGQKAQKKLNLKELRGGREEGRGTDKAVFNEKGMCILRIFMTISFVGWNV